MTVSSMMPPLSFSSTESVEVYGARAESDEGVSHSRKAVAPGPRKLYKKRRQNTREQKVGQGERKKEDADFD